MKLKQFNFHVECNDSTRKDHGDPITVNQDLNNSLQTCPSFLPLFQDKLHVCISLQLNYPTKRISHTDTLSFQSLLESTDTNTTESINERHHMTHSTLTVSTHHQLICLS